RVNERIRARQVRVIDEGGEQLGIMSVEDARRKAEERELDLIEVAPNAKPPVCRIMDYGKFRYDARKKAKEAQRKQKQTEVKMVRVRPNTGGHDLTFKMKNARKFLVKGNKVKFNVIFRGPELRHKEIGQHQLEVFIEGCKDIAQVDQPPRMEGRRMTMILEPRPDLEAILKKMEEAGQPEPALDEEGVEDLEDDDLDEDEDGDDEDDAGEAGAADAEPASASEVPAEDAQGA
ncbi:MAG: translation initiation factor IF-3, partial [Acidobacteriota bacterium]|nr:translation initiation factor IF-3 [Acidobacteriota bacterium]